MSFEFTAQSHLAAQKAHTVTHFPYDSFSVRLGWSINRESYATLSHMLGPPPRQDRRLLPVRPWPGRPQALRNEKSQVEAASAASGVGYGAVAAGDRPAAAAVPGMPAVYAASRGVDSLGLLLLTSEAAPPRFPPQMLSRVGLVDRWSQLLSARRGRISAAPP